MPLLDLGGALCPQMGDSVLTEMTATVGKTEASRDAETPSTASSPEPEPAAYAQDTTQQQQKRKGGRKPVSYYPACETSKTMPTMTLTPRKIYATSEERKQRNRQAQAAFRERRTEYIKQLESTIKHHEDTLQNLQQSHRSAADECLMLRYKNSLLERILLEKGNRPLRDRLACAYQLTHLQVSMSRPSCKQRLAAPT